MKGKAIFSNYQTYYVNFDNVEGLAKSAPVTLNGLAIGKVNTISINPKNGKLEVELQITTDFPISATSKAVLYEPGLIGGKQILIEPDFTNPTLAKNGQLLVGDIKLSLSASIQEKLVPLQEKFEKVIVEVDHLLSGVNNVLDETTQKELKITLSELSKTMKQVNAATSTASNMLNENKSDLRTVVANFKKVSSDFTKISDSLNKADLGKTVTRFNSTLTKVDAILADLQ